MQARIVNVSERTIGTALIADASAGATLLTVDDVLDFDLTGTLQIGGLEVVDYFAIDENANTISLSTPLANSYVTDDLVIMYPASIEREALLVSFDTDPGDDEGMVATVPQSLYEKVPVGVRQDGTGEAVRADFFGDELMVTDVLGQVPVIDASFIDTTEGVPSDGTPPASSPAIDSVLGSLRYVFLKWTAVSNADPVTYEVHISTSSGFTPGPSTKVQEIAGDFAAVNTLPNGTPLAYGTDYYFKLIAKDADGSAAPGTETAAVQLDPAAPDDIAAGSVTAAKLEAFLVLATTIATGTSGARIEMDSTGIKLYDSAGNLTMILDAQTGSIVIRGTFEFGSDPNKTSRLNEDTVDLVEQPPGFQLANHVFSRTNHYFSGTSFDAPFGRTTTSGNLLLLHIIIKKGTGTPQTISSPPSGWTQIATVLNNQIRVYTYKRENSAAKSSTGSFTLSASLGVSDNLYVTSSEFSGVQVSDVNTTASGTSNAPAVGPTGTQSATDGLVWASFAWGTAFPDTDVDLTPANSHGIAFAGAYTSPSGQASTNSFGMTVFAEDVGILETVGAAVGLPSSADWIATVVFFIAKTASGVPDVPSNDRIRIYASQDSRGDTQLYALSDANITDTSGVEYGLGEQLSGVPYASEWEYYTDFIGSAVPAEVALYANNGGTSALQAGVANHPGVVHLTTGTTSNATGNAGLRLGDGTTPTIVLGTAPVRFGCLLKVPGAVTTPFAHIRAGLVDISPQGDPAVGFSFRWDGNVNSNKWQMGIGGTYTDTQVTVVASTWYMLEIVVSADATFADFFINGSSVGSSSGAAQTGATLFPAVGIDKDTSTTTSRVCDVDLLYVRSRMSGTRY